jgi:hypothetical protein
VIVLAAGWPALADDDPTAPHGEYRGTWTVVNFDVSPPLREIAPLPVDEQGRYGGAMVDPESHFAGPQGPQTPDARTQAELGDGEIPAPTVSFDGPSNLAGVSPPDSVGDVGPNHYVAMSNLYFEIYDKTGTSVYGPAANNTLWSGFGGKCETDNAGDPIVLYDQLSDRWFLTQFTSPSSGSPYYNCVAMSQTGDPTGAYYRWAFSTGINFPDYPKYGIWPDALYISTREFANAASFAGIGAYAVNRAELVAGNPSPTVVSFLVTPASAGGEYNIGDGLLPSDLDGDELPPANSPNYFVGSMDDGGQYSAPQDALTLWKFDADFATPANSTFVLTDTIPIGAYDTQFDPCSGRSCIPQPGTSNRVDILSYRQRPIHRLAYRNFGTHESLVTNQSVEAGTGIAGNRWWEIRDPNGTPTIYQEGTFAPGVTDGIHRWMGSIAMDQSGNMALGYSASDGTSTYPSVWYTGRLVDDALGTMPQGEESIIDGTGSQTGSQRWGDYSSLNIDPVDDCTFWYVNQYVPSSSSVGWRLRIGSFAFDTCGCDLVIDPPVASAVVGGDNLVVVSWDDSATPEITEYRVYRSFTSGGPYDLVATVADTSPGVGGGTGYSWDDTDVSGGIEYFYVVRSSDGASCLSASSAEVSVTATGACTLDPTFSGLTSVTNPQLDDCALELEWSAGTPVCGASVVYNVYRSETPGFTPGPANLVASCVSGTSYTDTGVNSQTFYSYVVRAEDDTTNGSGPCNSGNEEANAVEMTAAPTGPDVLFFAEDFDTDDGGLVGTLDWEWGDSYSWTATGCGGSYAPPPAPHSGGGMWGTVLNGCYNNLGNNTGYADCNNTSPADDSILSFQVDLTSTGSAEFCWWEWRDLYLPWDWGQVYANGDMVFEHCGGSYSAPTDWVQQCVDLGAYAGTMVDIEFHMMASSVVNYAGWYIDDIEVFHGSDCGDADHVFSDDFEDGHYNNWSAHKP